MGSDPGTRREIRHPAQLRRLRYRGAHEGAGGSRAAHRRLRRRHLGGGGPHVAAGVGTYANWDERLDAQLAAAVMSLQAVKAVEIGDAVRAATSLGSDVHDEIGYERGREESFTGFTRRSNHAGGLEGGVSNGEDIRVRGYLKPISTLRRPLGSVDFASREPVKAAYERSDVCVVPAAGVAAESMVALTLARCALEKFGGDSVLELRRNFEGYCQQLRNF